jgi:hypothetical protein
MTPEQALIARNTHAGVHAWERATHLLQRAAETHRPPADAAAAPRLDQRDDAGAIATATGDNALSRSVSFAVS